MGKRVEIQSQQELIKSLAHKGDPTAFFTLISPYLRKKYLKERVEGKEHKEIVKKLIYEAVEYLSEIQELTQEKFNHWIEENISSPSETTHSQNEEEFNIENEKKIKSELDGFLSRCHRELMRAAATIKRNRIVERKKFPQVLYYNKVLRAFLIVFCSIILIIGVAFVMYWQKLSIRISLVKDKEVFSFSLPPLYSLTKDIKENMEDSVKNINTTKDSMKTTQVIDTVKSNLENKMVKKDSSPVSQIKKTISPMSTTPAVQTVPSVSTISQIPPQRKTVSSSEQSGITVPPTPRPTELPTDTTAKRMSTPSTVPSSQPSNPVQGDQPTTPSSQSLQTEN
ncbi:MAG: hypothetical protein N2053_05810 [Chitinispirillaceae bacterium]|nr:hypothetical protein [Chitinispirillaceae bacterium]